MSPTAEASGSATADDADDVWSRDMQSSVMRDVGDVTVADNVKRGSLEFQEDLLRIKPYVTHML